MNTEQYDTDVAVIAEQAQGLTILDDVDLSNAQGMQLKISALIKEVTKAFDEPRTKAFAAHRAIVKVENDLLGKAKESRKILGVTIATYKTEQERIRQAKIREEEARIRKENQEREAFLKKEADEQAARLEAKGDDDAALQVMEKADTIAEDVAEHTRRDLMRMNATVAPPPKAVKGLRTTTNYWGRISDESLIPRKYYVLDSRAIDRDIRAARGKIQIPGVEVCSETKEQ